jgi:four helix bundle protein
MRNVNDYEVFKRSHRLTLDVYEKTKAFPREELFGLVSQMRRAAYSIPMNLKEGSAGTEPEFFRYVRIALGSKEELDYQLLLAKDLSYITKEDWRRLTKEVQEIGRMLYGLMNKKAQT